MTFLKSFLVLYCLVFSHITNSSSSWLFWSVYTFFPLPQPAFRPQLVLAWTSAACPLPSSFPKCSQSSFPSVLLDWLQWLPTAGQPPPHDLERPSQPSPCLPLQCHLRPAQCDTTLCAELSHLSLHILFLPHATPALTQYLANPHSGFHATPSVLTVHPYSPPLHPHYSS